MLSKPLQPPHIVSLGPDLSVNHRGYEIVELLIIFLSLSRLVFSRYSRHEKFTCLIYLVGIVIVLEVHSLAHAKNRAAEGTVDFFKTVSDV